MSVTFTVPVLAHINGVEYRSRVAVYGGQVYLGLRLELLRRVGRRAGDMVKVQLVETTDPAMETAVTEPPDLHEADTRADRVARTVRRLSR